MSREKKLTFVQAMRRIGQQMGGWQESFASQDAQMPIIKKLYDSNGLELIMTCGACPEQYDVFKDGEQVGYLRLRHGEFRVDFPDCGDETIYEASPNGDGIFDDNERLIYMNNAMKAILQKLTNSKNH